MESLLDELMGDGTISIGKVKPDDVQVPSVMLRLSHKLAINDTCMLHTSGVSSIASFLHRWVQVLILHSERQIAF